MFIYIIYKYLWKYSDYYYFLFFSYILIYMLLLKCDKVGESVFLGSYIHNIDKKNRLSLPTKLRNGLGTTIILSKGFDGCLTLRTPKDFDEYTKKLLALSQTKVKIRTISRQLLANASEIDIDSANRILIPANLMKEANLENSITIIGLGDKLEIWNSNDYNELKNISDKSLEELAESIEDESI